MFRAFELEAIYGFSDLASVAQAIFVATNFTDMTIAAEHLKQNSCLFAGNIVADFVVMLLDQMGLGAVPVSVSSNFSPHRW